MSLTDLFQERLDAASGDAELKRNSPHLEVTVSFELPAPDQPIAVKIAGGSLVLESGAEPDIIVRSASTAAWERLVASPQPPLHNSMTALQIANPDFDVTGDPLLIAQARAALDRLVECLSPVPPVSAAEFERDPGQITGHYVDVKTDGAICRYFFETAGSGKKPLVFLHTAGADSRQYHAQMSDVALGHDYRLYAPDMPYHGRSMPPESWDGGPYLLTTERYRFWVADFIEQVVGEPVVLVGGSMGAAISLVMAAERPDLVRGVVALEPPFRSKGRRNPYQDHVAVHAGLHNSAFTRGLMSPTSPLSLRRAASWIYTQGAPGVYRGDLSFYSDDFDGAEVGPRIDAEKTPIALLSGTYDFSATPEDGAKLAAEIPGSLHLVMDGLGRFPATERNARKLVMP